MKSKAKNIEECSTLFEIEVKKETIAKAFDEVYQEITRYSNIPGFRVGRAPIDLVKKHYAKDAKEEVLKRLIPEMYGRALKEHGIEAIAMPEISDLKFEEGQTLFFKAKVNTRPKFKISNYKGIKVEKKSVAIAEQDVKSTLENLREMHARYINADDRPVQMSDYVVSDLDCFVDGKPVHKKRENLWLFIDKESLLSGLTEKMIGMKKGEEKDLEVALPANYPDKNLAGKMAKYHVLAKEIKLRDLPAVDDAFAKDLGIDSLDNLKKEITLELEARAKMNSQIDMENQVLNKLMDDNVFAVPSTFVDRQLEWMVGDAKKRLAEKGFKKEDLDKKDKEFKDKFKNDAVRQVRLIFILDEIARSEHIEVDEKDIETAYKSISAQTGKSETEVREHYEKEDLIDSLKDKLREGKVIQFLLNNSSIMEKT